MWLVHHSSSRLWGPAPEKGCEFTKPLVWGFDFRRPRTLPFGWSLQAALMEGLVLGCFSDLSGLSLEDSLQDHPENAYLFGWGSQPRVFRDYCRQCWGVEGDRTGLGIHSG